MLDAPEKKKTRELKTIEPPIIPPAILNTLSNCTLLGTLSTSAAAECFNKTAKAIAEEHGSRFTMNVYVAPNGGIVFIPSMNIDVDKLVKEHFSDIIGSTKLLPRKIIQK